MTEYERSLQGMRDEALRTELERLECARINAQTRVIAVRAEIQRRIDTNEVKADDF